MTPNETSEDTRQEDQAAAAPPQTGMRAAFQQAWERAKNGDLNRQQTGQEQVKNQDRTRLMLLLGAGAVVLAMLFIGLFSTERKSEVRTKPNLGRPSQTAAQNPGSIAPLMNALPAAEEADNDIDPSDIANTAKKKQKERVETEEVAPRQSQAMVPTRTYAPPPNYALNQIPYSDPGDAYRRQEPAYPPAPPPPPPNPNLAMQQAQREQEGLRKSSLIYVRQNGGAVVAPVTAGVGVHQTIARQRNDFLPVGTKLVARIQDAVTTAVKTPVLAVIEYHYERDGEIVVPAGTRAVGEFEQANQQGIVSLKFHTLEFADGHEEKIEGGAIGLDHGPLKGQVNGSNRGKRVLTRTLTGIGTVAANLAGGNGYRLGGPIDNSVLLRERLAQNIGMAGEQEMMALNSNQNTSVTVPGNTRFYLVLRRAAGDAPSQQNASTGNPNLRLSNPDGPSALPTAAELRELIALKQELTNLYSRVPAGK